MKRFRDLLSLYRALAKAKRVVKHKVRDYHAVESREDRMFADRRRSMRGGRHVRT